MAVGTVIPKLAEMLNEMMSSGSNLAELNKIQLLMKNINDLEKNGSGNGKREKEYELIKNYEEIITAAGSLVLSDRADQKIKRYVLLVLTKVAGEKAVLEAKNRIQQRPRRGIKKLSKSC